VQFLTFHHVFPDEERRFRKLIAYLLDGHTFISYSAAVRRLVEGPIDRPYVCMTFDDGLASSARAGRILAEHGISACFFVVASVVGERDPERVRRFCANRLNMPWLQLLDWDGVDVLMDQGHEVGSHTMRHVDLSQASEHELVAELRDAREVLEARVGRAQHFAWPYGRFRHFSRLARRVAGEAGYSSCASGERGAHVATVHQSRDLCIRRDHVPAAWPLRHIEFFLARSARHATSLDGEWPDALDEPWGRARGGSGEGTAVERALPR
jgi:peptidoglycan/xylan/chitin deacetylase (PgdA/CDA1 family)